MARQKRNPAFMTKAKKPRKRLIKRTRAKGGILIDLFEVTPRGLGAGKPLSKKRQVKAEREFRARQRVPKKKGLIKDFFGD